jgi:hypothetical protein
MALLLPGSRWLLVWITLRHWRWRRHVPPKCRLTFNGRHGDTSQKTEALNALSEYNYNVNSISLWLTSSSNNPSRHIVTKCFILFISPEDVSFVSPESRMDNKWRMLSNKTSCNRVGRNICSINRRIYLLYIVMLVLCSLMEFYFSSS